MIRIIAWIARLPRWLWAAALIVLAGAALVWWHRASLGEVSKQASATAQAIERSNHQQEVLNNGEKAKGAVERRDDARDRRLCEQDSRTPENC